MNNQQNLIIKIKDYIYFVLLLIVALIIVLPLIWLFSASVQGISAISRTPFDWIPRELLLRNYVYVWNAGKMGNAFLSSICASSLYIVFHLFICTLSGFLFAKYKFRFKNTIFTFILLTMMVPPEITYFQVYDIIKKLGALNTYPGLVLPFVMSGFGVFFMRQFATYIPNELLECAKIDGCGNFRTFFQIALPLLKAAVSALAILAFVYIWNEYPWSFLVINSDKMRTLPVTLSWLANSVFSNEVASGGVIALTPVFGVFLIFQRQFIESITNNGIKG